MFKKSNTNINVMKYNTQELKGCMLLIWLCNGKQNGTTNVLTLTILSW